MDDPGAHQVRSTWSSCDALRGSPHGIDVLPCPAARPNDLRRALLTHKPHVVHFSGHGHIDCALGMSRPITDQAAIEFATAFYEALAFGRSVEQAFELGRNATRLNDFPASASGPTGFSPNASPSKRIALSVPATGWT